MSVLLAEPPAVLDTIRVRFATFRDRPARQRADLAGRLARIAADERVLLETCHRVELVSVDDTDTGAAAGAVVAGQDAVRRVFEVVAGFDSAVVAEEQLLGQARGAYETALASGATGPILNELFRRALRFGRRVRSHARPGTDRSLADRGVAWLLERLTEGASRVLVAGTGEMGRLAASRLADAGYRVTVASTSAERGGRLRARLRGSGHRLAIGAIDAADIRMADGLVLAVRTREPVLTASLLAGGARPWSVDLSAPPGVDRDASRLLGARLLSLEQLGRLAGGRAALAPSAERRLRAELHDEVERFVGWLAGRRGAGALGILHGQAAAVRRRHLDRLRRSSTLDDDQLAAVEAITGAMVAELLHGPSVELRRGGADAAIVRRLFGIER